MLDTGGGTGFTFGATTFRYRVQGDWIDVTFDITITDVGAGGVSVRFSLPISKAENAVGSAAETVTSGALLNPKATGVDDLVRITTVSNGFPAANNSRIIGSIRYRRN